MSNHSEILRRTEEKRVTLLNLLQTYPNQIIKRWRNLRGNGRLDFIRSVHPQLQYEPYTVSSDDELQHDGLDEFAFKLPWLSQRLLAQDPQMFLRLLHMRTKFAPLQWAQHDFRQCKSVKSCVSRTYDPPGVQRHESWLNLDSEDLRLVEDVQLSLMDFMINLVDKIHPKSRRTERASSDRWSRYTSEKIDVHNDGQEWSLIARQPYCNPLTFDIQTIHGICLEQRKYAEDNVWLLRTHPDFCYDRMVKLKQVSENYYAIGRAVCVYPVLSFLCWNYLEKAIEGSDADPQEVVRNTYQMVLRTWDNERAMFPDALALSPAIMRHSSNDESRELCMWVCKLCKNPEVSEESVDSNFDAHFAQIDGILTTTYYRSSKALGQPVTDKLAELAALYEILLRLESHEASTNLLSEQDFAEENDNASRRVRGTESQASTGLLVENFMKLCKSCTGKAKDQSEEIRSALTDMWRNYVCSISPKPEGGDRTADEAPTDLERQLDNLAIWEMPEHGRTDHRRHAEPEDYQQRIPSVQELGMIPSCPKKPTEKREARSHTPRLYLSKSTIGEPQLHICRIKVSDEVFETLSHLWPQHNCQPRDVHWSKFTKAMAGIGFSVFPQGGSAYSFRLKDKGRIVFHKPHPSPYLDSGGALQAGKRLQKWFGFSIETFTCE